MSHIWCGHKGRPITLPLRLTAAKADVTCYAVCRSQKLPLGSVCCYMIQTAGRCIACSPQHWNKGLLEGHLAVEPGGESASLDDSCPGEPSFGDSKSLLPCPGVEGCKSPPMSAAPALPCGMRLVGELETRFSALAARWRNRRMSGTSSSISKASSSWRTRPCLTWWQRSKNQQ